MPQKNVEIVSRTLEAFNERDTDALVDRYDPEVVADWSRSPGVEAGIYRGHAEVRRLLLSVLEAWDRITVSRLYRERADALKAVGLAE